MKNYDSTFPFKIGKAKQPSQKRIEKTLVHNISDYKPIVAYIRLMTSPYSFRQVWKMIITAVTKFFFPQYMEFIHLKHVPIKHVDHPLDETIPYKPEYIKIYLKFINYWIRPLVMLTERFGWIQGSKLCGEYLSYIVKTYSLAYDLYNQHMTTTYRPREKKCRPLRKAQNADPHFMCVPSLHISISVLTYSFYRMLFERENFTEAEKDKWNKELYDLGLSIAESVVYLKQHSVNCIPAAMYMMTKEFPELFPPIMAIDFINDFLRSKDDIKKEDFNKINSHIHFMYEHLVLEGTMEDDWTVPVLRWLELYEPYVPSYAKYSKIKP